MYTYALPFKLFLVVGVGVVAVVVGVGVVAVGVGVGVVCEHLAVLTLKLFLRKTLAL